MHAGTCAIRGCMHAIMVCARKRELACRAWYGFARQIASHVVASVG